MTARALLLALMATGLVSSLAGCVGSLLDSKQPVDTIYVIAPPPSVAAQPSTLDLAIATPKLAPGLENPRIAVLKGRELNYYTGARWGAELSQVLQNFLVQTFAGRGLYRSVASADVRASSDYMLAVEVTHFEAAYGDAAAPRAHVTLIGRLLKVNDRTLVDTLSADVSVQASSNNMGVVIAAFESAAQQAATRLSDQVATAARAAADRPTAPPAP